jgi:hypothetical protein
MKTKPKTDDLVRETLTQVSLELEASARAAKEAALCVSDKQAVWSKIQQMYARFTQASYMVDRLQAIAKDAAASSRAGDETDEP